MEIGTAFVTIRPETSGFEAELAAAVSPTPVDVPVTADVSDAEGAIESIDGTDVEVGVTADTSDAEGAIESIDAPPIEQQVTVDTSAAEADLGGLGDQVSGLASGLGGGGGATGALDAFSGAALGAGGASSIAASGGLAALAAGLGYAVSEGSEAQVTLAQLEQVVANSGANAGVTSSGLQDMASSLQRTAGFSDEAVMSGQAMVLMFANVRNVAGQPIFDRTIQSAADLARSPFGNGSISDSARTLGRALQDPASSFGRLARQGITFTDAQEQTITAMQESGDMAGAQAAMLDVLDGKVGGAADAYSGTFAGSVDRAKEAVGEMAEELGTGLLPILDAVSESVIDQVDRLNSWDQAVNGALLSGPVQAALESLNGGFEANGSVVGDLAGSYTAAADAADTYAASQQAAADAVSGTLPQLGDIISTADRAGEAFGVLNASSDPQVIIDNLSLALVAWDDFQANIETISAWGPNIAAELQQLGPEVAGGLTNALASGGIGMIAELDGLVSQVAARGGDVSAVLTGFAQGGMAGAQAAVAGAAPGMAAAGTQAGAAAAAGIDGGLATSRAGAAGMIAGTSFAIAVGTGITSMTGTVSGLAGASMAAAAANAATTASAGGRGAGILFGAGAAAGIASMLGAMTSIASSAGTLTGSMFGAAAANTAGAGARAAMAVAAGGIAGGAPYGIASSVGFSVGTLIGSGIAGGIRSTVGSIASAAAAAVNQAEAAARAAADSNSPSRVFMAVGKDLGDGLKLGFESAAAGLATSAAGQITAAANANAAGFDLGRGTSTQITGGGTRTFQVAIDGAVVAEKVFEWDRRIAYAEGFEQ